MSDKLQALGKTLSKQKKAPTQKAVIVKDIETTRATIEIPTDIYDRLKVHLASPRRFLKEYTNEAILEKMQRDGII